jgi:pimeloyl-ACP methyl ester carboxylesterase
MKDFQVPKAIQPGSVIVIGFLGGFEPWNDAHRGVRKVALDLRARQMPRVYAETIENRRRDLAVKLIKRAHARGVRVILYGQSWGGAAVLHVARKLKKMGLDVELTVQVDSVGIRDTLIPANVHAAANLFQHDPLTVDGQREIHAEDPARTRIIENTRLSYFFRPFETLNKDDTSWMRRTFGGSHAKMEADEAVWRHVEDLILHAIQ